MFDYPRCNLGDMPLEEIKQEGYNAMVAHNVSWLSQPRIAVIVCAVSNRKTRGFKRYTNGHNFIFVVD